MFMGVNDVSFCCLLLLETFSIIIIIYLILSMCMISTILFATVVQSP